MKNFVYKKFSTIGEACSFLSQNTDKAGMIAGGTDLLVKMKLGESNPDIIVDLKGIADLDGVHDDDGYGLAIGALTTIRTIETSAIIKEKFGVLCECAGLIGSVQIRNLGTVGGNICNASPSADMACCLMSLGANARIVGTEGSRSIPLEAFFTGPGETILKGGEILASVHVPNMHAHTGCAYIKHGIRKAMEIAVASVAVSMTVDAAKETCEEIKIALGAVAPTIMRAKKAEERLRGKKVDHAAIEEVSRTASEECKPITDVRGSAQYRKEMVRVTTERAIRQAMNEIM